MKKLLLPFLLLLVFPLVVFAEVAVKEEPLTWDKTARLPGDQLYQNLCANCHDSSGTGNGIASEALHVGAPDLTQIAASNGGVFPHKEIEWLIANDASQKEHGQNAMPAWEQQFLYVRTGLSSFQREAYARNRIHVLTEHLESLQIPN